MSQRQGVTIPGFTSAAPSHSSFHAALQAPRWPGLHQRPQGCGKTQSGLTTSAEPRGAHRRWEASPAASPPAATGHMAPEPGSPSCRGDLHPRALEPRQALVVALRGRCTSRRGNWSPPAHIIWVLFAKFPFPGLMLQEPWEQTAQRDPQITPTDPERAVSQPDPQPRGQRRPGPSRLHSTGGLFAGAPQTCPSTQGFCSNEKAPSGGKINKQGRKWPISLPRSAPCRTPSQNQVILLPLAPWSPCRCRQASSRLMCHQPKRQLSTNHRGFITAGSGQSREASHSDPSQGLSQGGPSIPPLSEQTPLPWTAELCLQQERAPSTVQDLLAPSLEPGHSLVLR